MVKNRLYVSTDINIKISLAGDLTVDEIQDMTVRLVKDPLNSIEFTLLNNDIEIVASEITLKIPRTSITAEGKYFIYIIAVDAEGNHLGLTPDPLDLFFHKNT